MELSTAVKTRRSIRAFKTDAVPKEVITQILETARWSPSWGNTQPWELVVVQGDKVRQLTGELVAAFQQRMAANPDVAMPGTFPDVYKERYMACAAGLFGGMGVARDDKASRMAHMVNMTGGFGAPAIIYVIFNADLLEPYSMFDLGCHYPIDLPGGPRPGSGDLHRGATGPVPGYYPAAPGSGDLP